MSSATETWTCPRCSAENKPSWRFCTSCESMPDGRRRADHQPPPPKDPATAVLPGLVLVAVLAVLVVGAVLYGPQAWDSASAYLGG